MAQARAQIDGAVFQAADTLVEALRHTPQWEEWEHAKAAFDRDDRMRAWRRRLEELAARWRQAQRAGRGLTGQEASELARLQEQLQRAPLFVRQQEAAKQLIALLQQTNDLITSLLGIDFAANAVRRGGGCCG